MDNQRNIRDVLKEIHYDNEALYNVLDIFVQSNIFPSDRMSIITREGVEYILVPMMNGAAQYNEWNISVDLDVNFNVVQCTVGTRYYTSEGPVSLDERHYNSLIEALEVLNYDSFVDLVQASSLQMLDFDDDSVYQQNERMELMQQLDIT